MLAITMQTIFRTPKKTTNGMPTIMKHNGINKTI